MEGLILTMEIFGFDIPLFHVFMFAFFVILTSAMIVYDEVKQVRWDNLGGKDINTKKTAKQKKSKVND